jgi:aspartate ammonia-lyase
VAVRPGQRIERDLLGPVEVPSEARYGVHTVRALRNFTRRDELVVADVPAFARAFGMVKLAALRANVRAGALGGSVAAVLDRACCELADGARDLVADLVVPVVQGGAGTSTNMNVNEVLANRALEILGHELGSYEHCHPNDHVNRSQSTNDVYPTALRLALLLRGEELGAATEALAGELETQASRYGATPKLGRTQLQDAVPMTVGEELRAWADGVRASAGSVRDAATGLLDVNLGGTAIGTGLTAAPGYADSVVPMLAEVCGLPVRRAARAISATTGTNDLLTYSAALRSQAVAVAKIANDLRLLSSGPRTGLGELRIPAVQGGSSMMPGKVNPVVPEYVNQLAFRVRGADDVVAMALDAGQLQLHAMLPIVASQLFAAQDDLSCAMRALGNCVAGLEVDDVVVRRNARSGLGELSELAAERGYAAATKAAVTEGRVNAPGTDVPPTPSSTAAVRGA